MRIRFGYYLILISFMSCSNPEIFGQDQGVVIVKRKLFDSDTIMEVNFKIRYKDKQSIQEVIELNTKEDSLGKQFFTKILFYTYLDPEKNICYNYKRFSDTATVYNYFTNIDSVKINGGWNFYTSQPLASDSIIKLNDTTLNGIHYNKVRIDKKLGENNLYSNIYFFRCDKKGGLVSFFKSLSDKIGCPAVKVDTWKNNKLITSVEIIFISDKLSMEELKVFQAWGNNVVNN